MRRSALPAVLVAAAAGADAFGLHEPAFYLLVAAVPAGAVASLTVLGDALDGTGDRFARVRVVLSGLALMWIVIAAAVRSASIDEGAVPPGAASALAVCLVVFALQAVVSLAAGRVPGYASSSAVTNSASTMRS